MAKAELDIFKNPAVIGFLGALLGALATIAGSFIATYSASKKERLKFKREKIQEIYQIILNIYKQATELASHFGEKQVSLSYNNLLSKKLPRTKEDILLEHEFEIGSMLITLYFPHLKESYDKVQITGEYFISEFRNSHTMLQDHSNHIKSLEIDILVFLSCLQREMHTLNKVRLKKKNLKKNDQNKNSPHKNKIYQKEYTRTFDFARNWWKQYDG